MSAWTYRVILLTIVCYLLPDLAAAQIYVAPRRPGKSMVRYFDHDWYHMDLLVGEELSQGTSGGVRLFFYEDERENAERAAAAVEAAYRRLAEELDYAPSRRFDYILYGSYQAFLRTNLFPLQEGVLGVTGTRTLEVTLPYRGDFQAFEHVSTHELAHEFTIQKLRDVASEAEVRGDPLNLLPLWFIEGSAEYYAQQGMDDEARMVLRDIVTNPELLRLHGLLDFFIDYRGSNLWTYKIGQARVAFLEETYGEGTTRRIMEETPWMFRTSVVGAMVRVFPHLLEKVTGDEPSRISARFEDWAKRQAFTGWLGTVHSAASFEPVERFPGMVNGLATSPNGNLLLYRSIAEDTGRTSLYLVDRRVPGDWVVVARAGVPGVESLKPVDGRSFAVGDDRVLFIAERRGYDVIYQRRIKRHDVRREALEESPELDPSSLWTVRLTLGRKEAFSLKEHGVVAAWSPALSPSGDRLGFIGLDGGGQRDLYVLHLEGERAGEVQRITRDVAAERDTAWGPMGLVFSSDATGHGHHNLFIARPEDDMAVEQLTFEPEDHRSPVFQVGGRLLFVAWRDGHAELHELKDQAIWRRTAVDTGLFQPSSGPGRDTWALHYKGGRRVPSLVPWDELLAVPVLREEAKEEPEPLPRRSLDDADPYKPYHLENWRPDMIFGLLGAGAGSVFGMAYVSASDRLRDHALILSAVIYGSLEFSDGYLVYLNQSGRFTWGGGPFQSLRFRVDRTFEDEEAITGPVQTAERYLGGLGVFRHPFNRFVYLQVEQSVGGVSYLLTGQAQAVFYGVEAGDGTLLDRWLDIHEESRLQEETTARFGVDTIQYHPGTGAVGGGSALLEGSLAWQPEWGEVFSTARLDLEGYLPLPLGSGANIGFRGSGAGSFGGPLARSYYLSSYDTLRAVEFGDIDFLLGRYFVFTGAELQVPLSAIIATAFTTNIEAVAGIDGGAVAESAEGLWDKRVLDVALGGNLILGPLVFRVHFAHALDIGAPLPSDRWVPNISLSWLYL